MSTPHPMTPLLTPSVAGETFIIIEVTWEIAGNILQIWIYIRR